MAAGRQHHGAMANKLPDRELGTVPGLTTSYSLTHGNGYMVDPLEMVPELTWPLSIAVYDKMRKSDGQFGGLLRAMTLPITNAKWDLVTDGVKDEVVALVRGELGMVPPGETQQRRRREGIVWRDHVKDALLMMPFGHMVFEQVYNVGKPSEEQKKGGLTKDKVIHLRKLAPRYPRTLTEIRVARDGGLEGVFQNQPPYLPNQSSMRSFDPIFIPVDRLVFYCMEREGADWTGTSVFRSAYKNWFLKEVLLRLSAQVLERNGMGLPVVTYSNDGAVTKQDALAIARAARAGADAGVALPEDAKFEMMGVSGSTPDILPYINYHDQAASRSLLAMFMDLGHDNGARSLGETFVDLFTANLQYFAEQIADTATEHIVRDLVEWNYGPDEPYPIITPGDMSANKEVSSTVLSTLVSAKLVTPDGDLEDHIRLKYGLPEANEERRPAPLVPMVAPDDPNADPKAALKAKLQPQPPSKAKPAEGKLKAVPEEKTAASEAPGGQTAIERLAELVNRLAELQ
jgi:hypothetical protein